MKTARKVFLIALVVLALISLCACDDGKGSTEPGTYTIQYADDAGLHTIDVTSGQLYSIDSIPIRNGYEFIGLYDSEQGGTQYVNASGSALTVFTDNRSLVLYPQFRAKQFTLILDYQGADVTGSRSITVDYDSNISNLPTNLTMENKTFSGWFTSPDKKGTQIADCFGVLPQKSKVTENNFDLSDPDGYIYLYAGFTGELHTVRFYYGNDPTPEEMQIEHGTYISEVITTKRVDGKAAISWTKASGSDEVFTGKVEGEMILYAYEYAPVIEFNSNGGEKINPIIARPGDSISLPISTKDLAKFLYWEDIRGNKYTATIMPSESISLKAVWQAKIVFDSNGGTDVNSISEKAGEKISLPVPLKEGFIFAGWYTEGKELYINTIMPSDGVKLKAGWHVARKKAITIIENSIDKKKTTSSNTFSEGKRLKIDLSEFLPQISNGGVEIKYTINFRWGAAYTNRSAEGKIALYEGSELNSYYELKSKYLSHTSEYDTYIKDSFRGASIIKANVLYLYYAGKANVSFNSEVAFYDISIEMEYPDVDKLYL